MNDASKPDYKARSARTSVPSIIHSKRDSSRYRRTRSKKGISEWERETRVGNAEGFQLYATITLHCTCVPSFRSNPVLYDLWVMMSTIATQRPQRAKERRREEKERENSKPMRGCLCTRLFIWQRETIAWPCRSTLHRYRAALELIAKRCGRYRAKCHQNSWWWPPGVRAWLDGASTSTFYLTIISLCLYLFIAPRDEITTSLLHSSSNIKVFIARYVYVICLYQHVKAPFLFIYIQ